MLKRFIALACVMCLVLSCSIVAMASGNNDFNDVYLRGCKNQLSICSGLHQPSSTYVYLRNMGGSYNSIYCNVYDGTTSSGQNLAHFDLYKGESNWAYYNFPQGNTVSLYAGNNTWTYVTVWAYIFCNL